MKAMIFAAGLGMRLKPITDTKPKALVSFQGITLLEYAIRKLKFYGVRHIVINVHHFAEQIIDFVKQHNFGVSISISDESQKLLNTGGGLLNAQDFLNDSKPFFVYNVDIISTINLHDLYAWHIKNNALATLAVKDRKTSRYLLFDEHMQLSAWVNRATKATIITRNCTSYIPRAFSGIQIIDPKIFPLIQEDGAFSITDLYLRLSENHCIVAYNHTNDFWLDVGKFDEISDVETQLATHKLEFL